MRCWLTMISTFDAVLDYCRSHEVELAMREHALQADVYNRALTLLREDRNGKQVRSDLMMKKPGLSEPEG